MELNSYLSNRLSEVLTKGKLIAGTNFKEQIIDLNWEEATRKIENLNTIADLTFHIHYYINGVMKVLEGGSLEIRDKFSFDAPPIKTPQDWQTLVDNFCADSEKLIRLVENMTNEKLLSDFLDEKYGSYQRNIDIMIEHTYYHLGQIILIKKLVRKLKG